jgi:hypothetical protein
MRPLRNLGRRKLRMALTALSITMHEAPAAPAARAQPRPSTVCTVLGRG